MFDTVLPIDGSVEGISFQRLSQMHVNMSETSVIEMSSVFEMSQEIILSLFILELFRLLNSSTQITIVSASTESKSIASVLLESKSTIVFDNKEKNMLFIFLICLTIQYLLSIIKTSSSILKLYYTGNSVSTCDKFLQITL